MSRFVPPHHHENMGSKDRGFEQLLTFGHALEAASNALSTVLPGGLGTAAFATGHVLGVANKVVVEFSRSIDHARSAVDQYAMYSLGGLRAAQSINIADLQRQIRISRELQGSMLGFADSFNKMNDQMKSGVIFAEKFQLSMGKVGADIAGTMYTWFVDPIVSGLDKAMGTIAEWLKQKTGIDINYPTAESAQKKREELIRKRQAAFRGELTWDEAKGVVSPLEFVMGMGPQVFRNPGPKNLAAPPPNPANPKGGAGVNAALRDRMNQNRARGGQPGPGGPGAGGFVPVAPLNMKPQAAPAPIDPAVAAKMRNLARQEGELDKAINARKRTLERLAKENAGKPFTEEERILTDETHKYVRKKMELNNKRVSLEKIHGKLPPEMPTARGRTRISPQEKIEREIRKNEREINDINHGLLGYEKTEAGIAAKRRDAFNKNPDPHNAEVRELNRKVDAIHQIMKNLENRLTHLHEVNEKLTRQLSTPQGNAQASPWHP